MGLEQLDLKMADDYDYMGAQHGGLRFNAR